METYFSTNASFSLVETNFLACTNHLLYFFRNEFLNESFITAFEEEFFSLVETVTLLKSFFLLAETIMSGNEFLTAEFILARGN